MASDPNRRDAASRTAPTLPDVEWVSGLRILVTGAAGALGRGLVDEAIRQGASVAATGREPSLGAAELPAAAVRVPADLADPEQCRALAERAAAALGGLDVLVNNAAVLTRADFADLSLDDFERAWQVNLRAPVLLMQAARPYLEQSAAAAIVNVISTAAFNGGVDHVAPYAMTKAGLVAVTKSVAKEYGPLGIRVLCLSPPAIESQMRTNLTPEVNARVRTASLLGRMADIREVALTTLFAASPYASFVTGSTIDVTGSVL
jgi:NAD(P)-dependent dehydrogenase (short-subunit alcohol dehydrogenase family)